MTKKERINLELYKTEFATLQILEGILSNIQAKPLDNGGVEILFPNLPPQDSIVELLKYRSIVMRSVASNPLFELAEPTPPIKAAIKNETKEETKEEI